MSPVIMTERRGISRNLMNMREMEVQHFAKRHRRAAD